MSSNLLPHPISSRGEDWRKSEVHPSIACMRGCDHVCGMSAHGHQLSQILHVLNRQIWMTILIVTRTRVSQIQTKHMILPFSTFTVHAFLNAHLQRFQRVSCMKPPAKPNQCMYLSPSRGRRREVVRIHVVHFGNQRLMKSMPCAKRSVLSPQQAVTYWTITQKTSRAGLINASNCVYSTCVSDVYTSMPNASLTYGAATTLLLAMALFFSNENMLAVTDFLRIHRLNLSILEEKDDGRCE